MNAASANPTHTDENLVRRVLDQDHAACEHLVRRYERTLLSVVVKLTGDPILAEDVVQETFMKAFTEISQFRGEASFKSWIVRIAINTAKNKFRSKKRETVDIENVVIIKHDAVDTRLYHTALALHLREEVERLPLRQRQALVLRVFEDLSFQEIAEIMGCPYDTAKANYRHALMRLKARVVKDARYRDWRELRKLMQETSTILTA
jgi:RNA polymerase sigma-70 factor (ECF subfamily)